MGQSLQARDRGYSSIRRKKIPSKNSCNEAVTLTEAYKSALMAEGFNAASRQRAREAEDGSGRRGRKRKRSYDTEDDSENVVDDSGNGEETAVQAIKANFFDAAEKFGHEILDQLTARIARVERRQAATHAVHLQALSEIVDGVKRKLVGLSLDADSFRWLVIAQKPCKAWLASLEMHLTSLSGHKGSRPGMA